MLLKRSSVVAVCIGLALVHGCRRQAASFADLKITHEVSPQPPRAGQTTITLRLTDTSGKAVSGARIIVEGNMSHAGMVPVFVEAREVEPGLYRGTIALSMAGDWVVVAHVSLANGRELDHQFEIKGVASS